MKMQQALSQEEVAVERNGVRVVMSGDQKLKELVIVGEDHWRAKEVIGEAIKKSQEIAAKKLTEISGGLQGLMGQGK
jgi:DNA-binding protein YbaB